MDAERILMDYVTVDVGSVINGALDISTCNCTMLRHNPTVNP